MQLIHSFATVVGYVVLFTGTAALALLLAGLALDYAWRKWGDFSALVAVVNEAKRQGRSIFRDRRKG